MDWDTPDYNEIVSGICDRLSPVFRMFAKIMTPRTPFIDDF
jgi:hypothetical protein